MKVAIIGGGLAGIVCALQLERYGIIPDIYEKHNKLAEPFRHVGAGLEIALRPIKDTLQYLNENYNIYIKPSGLIKKVIHNSPNESTTIKGSLGYFIIRGADPDSSDYNLAKDLKCNIFLKQEVDYKDLVKVYDYVVIATGHPDEAKELGLWHEIISMCIKGTVISGNFDSDTFTVWLNKDYCRSGYAYMSPFNNREASLILAVDGVGTDEIDKYWKLFVKTEKLKYKIKEKFKTMHYAGKMNIHRVDNIFFIGNAAGGLDPLLGFGVFSSVITASEAAKSIAFGTDYEKNIEHAFTLNKRLLEFRKCFNFMENKDLDILVKLLGLPGVNLLFYNWTKINLAQAGYIALKPVNPILGFFKKPD